MFLLCSHHWPQPHPLPHPLPTPTAQGLTVSPSPTCPAPPHPTPLTDSPCERTPAPCPQCSAQQRRWSPSEPPPLALQSHSGLVRRSTWQRWHRREERWDGRKRGSESPFQHYHVYIPLRQVSPKSESVHSGLLPPPPPLFRGGGSAQSKGEGTGIIKKGHDHVRREDKP